MNSQDYAVLAIWMLVEDTLHYSNSTQRLKVKQDS